MKISPYLMLGVYGAYRAANIQVGVWEKIWDTQVFGNFDTCSVQDISHMDMVQWIQANRRVKMFLLLYNHYLYIIIIIIIMTIDIIVSSLLLSAQVPHLYSFQLILALLVKSFGNINMISYLFYEAVPQNIDLYHV